jgi:hypothetical protein
MIEFVVFSCGCIGLEPGDDGQARIFDGCDKDADDYIESSFDIQFELDEASAQAIGRPAGLRRLSTDGSSFMRDMSDDKRWVKCPPEVTEAFYKNLNQVAREAAEYRGMQSLIRGMVKFEREEREGNST